MDSKSKQLRKVRLMKIRYLLAVLTGQHRVKWLKKHDVFGLLGEKVLYQPIRLPNNPKLIRIHNNVRIASNVTFYEHDGINYVFQNIKPGNWRGHHTCIEIFDNCFIGGGKYYNWKRTNRPQCHCCSRKCRGERCSSRNYCWW